MGESTTVDCDAIDALLAARGEGPLPPDSAAALAAHLATCEECRAFAATLDAASAPQPERAPFPVVPPDIYELGPVIGRGGMGHIRSAIDLRLGRAVAIKELLYNTAELSARFVREARVAASLQHPNIVPVYDVGCWADGTPFYVMPLFASRSLFEALGQATSLPERLQLLPAVSAAADAVAFAHSQGVVHRDLTPANIMLGELGEAVVIDWGLAKDSRVDHARVGSQFRTGMTLAELTARGAVIGSPAYMPPEQAAGEVASERADVYALGAIIYHLLAGRPPYQAGTARELIAMVRAAPPEPLERVAPLAPRALRVIAARAMARDPDARHASAGGLAAALRRFQADLLAEASGHGGALARLRSLVRPRRGTAG